MSNFTPLVEKQYEFEGDNISVKFSRLKRKHMLRALPAMNKLAKAQTEENEDSANEFLNDFLNTIIDAIPEYIVEFSGLSDSQNNPVPIQTVVDDFYFLSLAAQISMDMVKESTAMLDTEGNV